MSSIFDLHDRIELQNSKSKEILDEYERIANEKRKKNKLEEDELFNQNLSLEKEIIKLTNSSNSLKNIYEDLNYIQDRINSNIDKIEKVRSKDIYPHGIYEFSLAYHNISKKLNIE